MQGLHEKAFETVSVSSWEEHQPTVVSNAHYIKSPGAFAILRTNRGAYKNSRTAIPEDGQFLIHSPVTGAAVDLSALRNLLASVCSTSGQAQFLSISAE